MAPRGGIGVYIERRIGRWRLVGISMVFSGMTRLMLSLAARRIAA